VAVTAEELKVIVRAEVTDAVTKLNSAKHSINQVDSSAAKSAISFAKKALAVGAAIKVTKLFIRATSDLIDNYQNQEEAERRLETTAGLMASTTNDQVEALKRLAVAQQKVTTLGDDVTIAGQSQLATFRLSTESIYNLTPAFQDLITGTYGVAASQEQAIQAANLLGKVFQGQIGALTRVGVTFDEAQGKILKTGNESEKVATLVDVLNSNYGGLSETMADTSRGSMQQLKNAFGDLKEVGGEVISDGLKPVVTWLTKVVSSAAEAAKEVVDVNKAIKAIKEDKRETISNDEEINALHILKAEAETLRDAYAANIKYKKENAHMSPYNYGASIEDLEKYKQEQQDLVDSLNDEIAALANKIRSEYRTSQIKKELSEQERERSSQIVAAQKEISDGLSVIAEKEKLYKDTFDDRAESQSLVQKVINKLLEQGFDIENEGLKELLSNYENYLSTASDETNKWTDRRIEAQKRLKEKFSEIEELQKFHGEEFKSRAEKETAVRDEILSMIEFGFTLEGNGIQRILAEYGDYLNVIDKVSGSKALIIKLTENAEAEIQKEKDAKQALKDINKQLLVAELSGNTEKIEVLKLVKKELEDILDIAAEQAELDKFKENIKSIFSAENVANQSVSMIEDLGAALASGDSAAETFGESFSQMAQSIMSQSAAYAMGAGLRIIAETGAVGLPVGLALIALGGGLAIGSGFLSGGSDYKSEYNYDSMILDKEEELHKERIALLQETIEEEQRLRNEAITKLDQTFNQEYEVLKDSWQRNLISTEEYQAQMSTMNKEYDTAVEIANAPLLAAQAEKEAAEQAKADLEKARREKLDTLARSAKTLQDELNNMSGWDKFWSGRNEEIEKSLASLDRRIAVVNSANDISTIKAAKHGADFVTNGPQLMLVGDNPSGAERVRIEPITTPNFNRMNSNQNAIVININAPVYGIDDLQLKLNEAAERIRRRGRV